MKPSLPIFWLIAFLGLLGSLAIVVGVWTRKEARTLVLSTGHRVLLRGLTYGTNHPAPGIALIKRLPASVEEPLSRLLGMSPGFRDRTTAEPELVARFEILPSPMTNVAFLAGHRWQLLDSDGRAGGRMPNLNFSTQSAKPQAVTEVFSVLPRRSPTLRLRLIDQTIYRQPHVVGEIEVENPGFLAAADPWIAQELPVSQTNGNLSLTVMKVVTGGGPQWTYRTQPDGKRVMSLDVATLGEAVHAGLAAEFAIDGRPTAAWTVGEIELADAGGNVLKSAGKSWSTYGTTLVLNWDPVLWPGETWEVRINAKRNVTAAFSDQELVEIPPLPITEVGELMALAGEPTVNGVQLTSGHFVLRPAIAEGSYSSSDLSQLSFSVFGLTNGLYLDLVQARDETGREHTPNQTGSAGGEGGALEISYGFPEIPSDVKTLSFRLAVHRGLDFVFRVQPELATTNTVLHER